MIRGIVFDFDGTLVDSNDIKVQTFYEVTKSHDPTGSTVTRILKQFPDKDRHGLFHAIIRELFNKDLRILSQDLEILAAQWTEEYTVRCEKAIGNCKEVPGTSETLGWIFKQHFPIFINSRTPTTTLKRLVTLRSLHSYVSEIYGAPATKFENLQLIENQTQARPTEILFVGDSDDDREAAQKAGCHFVGVILGGKSRFSAPPPERRITNLYQLQQIVETLHVIDLQDNNGH